jgi:hypothetical protein
MEMWCIERYLHLTFKAVFERDARSLAHAHVHNAEGPDFPALR